MEPSLFPLKPGTRSPGPTGRPSWGHPAQPCFVLRRPSEAGWQGVRSPDHPGRGRCGALQRAAAVIRLDHVPQFGRPIVCRGRGDG